MAGWPQAVLATFVSMLLVLGGCVGAGTKTGGGASDRADADAAALADATGGIRGTLVDEEIAPVEGAEVGIRVGGGATLNTTVSAVDGTFTFAGLEPGEYEVAVQSPGHKPAGKKVPVTAGEFVEVRFILKSLPPAVTLLVETYPVRGFITCSIGWYNTVVPLPPGNPIGNGTPEQANPCAAVVSGDKDHFKVPLNADLTFDEKVFNQILLELEWQPGTGFSGSHLRMDVCSEKPAENNYILQCKLVSGNNPYDRSIAGPPPLTMRRNDMPVDRIKDFEVTVGDGNWNYTTIRPPVTFQQSFDLWMSMCYFSNCTADFSARPPA